MARLADGESVEDTARAVGRAPSTVWGYLYEHLRTHGALAPSPWVSGDDFARVRSAIAELGPYQRLKTLHEHLGGTVSYEAIYATLVCLENLRESADEPS